MKKSHNNTIKERESALVYIILYSVYKHHLIVVDDNGDNKENNICIYMGAKSYIYDINISVSFFILL